MSGSVGSAWLTPNELMTARYGNQISMDAHRNALMQEQVHQQAIGSADTEMAARIAQSLVATGDDAKAAQLYPGMISEAQGRGFLKNAPSVWPGMEHAKRVAALGTSSEKLGDRATNKSGWDQILGSGTPGPGASAAPAGGDTSGTPFAANNPLNIRFVGQEGATNTRGFAAWPTPEAGQAATDHQLASYADKGINTLSGLITRWAPPSENDTAKYIATVSKATGLDPSAPLDLRDPAVRATVQKAMAVVEGNKNSPGVQQQASAAPVAPVGVAARTGGVDVAGPGGAPPGAPVGPQRETFVPGPGGVPQKALVPTDGSGPPVPVPPAASAPVQQAQTALAPPPQAPAPPQQPAAGGLLAGLQPDQLIALRALGATNATPAQGLQMIQHFKEQNAAAAQQAQTNLRLERGEQRAERGEVRAQADAVRLAHAADLQDQQAAIPTLTRLAPKIEDGTATPAERRLYSATMTDTFLKPRTDWVDDPDSPGKKIPTTVPGALPPGFPAPDYQPGQTTDTKPPPSKSTPLSAAQAKLATFADRLASSELIIQKFDDEAQSWAQSRKAKVGDWIGYSLNSPGYEQLKSAQENWITSKLRDESGALIGTDEFVRDRKTFFPQPGEGPDVVAQKKAMRAEISAGTARAAGPAYQPPVLAPEDPAKREKDKTYLTPKGRLKWDGKLWQPPGG